MDVFDKNRYARCRASSRGAFAEFWLLVLLFGSLGAITWAIRGTGGWGGMDGTVVPGMTWALLWYWVCLRKGIDARGLTFWLGLGIALGGGLGYGQYVSWIRGKFAVHDETIDIAPWVGYAWFMLCGAAWGGVGGIVLGWSLNTRASLRLWAVRIGVPIGVVVAGWLLIRACPWLIFPKYGLGFYTGELDKHLVRTVETNSKTFLVVCWWLGALLAAILQRDRFTLTLGALLGFGFAVGFALCATWCLGFVYAPGLIDWWKMWELGDGFVLGGLYVAALFWTLRQVDRAHDPEGVPLAKTAPAISQRRRNLSLAFAVFFLLGITAFGVTSRAGIVLGFYPEKAVDQYAWPWPRLVIFIPLAIVTFGILGKMLRRLALPPAALETTGFLERAGALIGLMGVVGAITIWPSKIGVFYALFVWIALFALCRLERRYRAIE